VGEATLQGEQDALVALAVPQQGIHLAVIETTQVVAIETIQVAKKNPAQAEQRLQCLLW